MRVHVFMSSVLKVETINSYFRNVRKLYYDPYEWIAEICSFNLVHNLPRIIIKHVQMTRVWYSGTEAKNRNRCLQVSRHTLLFCPDSEDFEDIFLAKNCIF